MVQGRKTPRLIEVPDGDQLLSSYDAAQLAEMPQDTLLKLAKRGVVHPARYGREQIFTRSEIIALRDNMRERAIATRLNAGQAPLQIWEELPHADAESVARVLRAWAKLAGFWIVEMPPGSFVRWCARFKLVRFGPVELRRALERLLETDPR